MRDPHTGFDVPHLKLARITGHTYSATSRALLLQSAGDGASLPGDPRVDSVYSAHFGEWCLVAPPAPPDADKAGNISAAADALVVELGDENLVLGTRDVRASKFAQDIEGGEFALVNVHGWRFAAKKKSLSLSAGGGFLNFDVASKKVGLSGIPSAPGLGAPYLAIDTTSIGLVSATGAASVNVHANQVTLSGAAASINAGSVGLGVGAADGVVLQSLLAATLVILQTWLNTHSHGAPGAVPNIPIVLPMLNASLRVKSA